MQTQMRHLFVHNDNRIFKTPVALVATMAMLMSIIIQVMLVVAQSPTITMIAMMDIMVGTTRKVFVRIVVETMVTILPIQCRIPMDLLFNHHSEWVRMLFIIWIKSLIPFFLFIFLFCPPMIHRPNLHNLVTLFHHRSCLLKPYKNIYNQKHWQYYSIQAQVRVSFIAEWFQLGRRLLHLINLTLPTPQPVTWWFAMRSTCRHWHFQNSQNPWSLITCSAMSLINPIVLMMWL